MPWRPDPQCLLSPFCPFKVPQALRPWNSQKDVFNDKQSERMPKTRRTVWQPYKKMKHEAFDWKDIQRQQSCLGSLLCLQQEGHRDDCLSRRQSFNLSSGGSTASSTSSTEPSQDWIDSGSLNFISVHADSSLKLMDKEDFDGKELSLQNDFNLPFLLLSLPLHLCEWFIIMFDSKNGDRQRQEEKWCGKKRDQLTGTYRL